MRFEPLAEVCRGGVVGHVGTHRRTQRGQPGKVGGEVGLGREALLEPLRRDRVELAVEIGAEQLVALVFLRRSHAVFSSIAAASRRRARASRDMTVPMGAPTTAAIS